MSPLDVVVVVGGRVAGASTALLLGLSSAMGAEVDHLESLTPFSVVT